MQVLDDEGRLFGVVNVIDALVVVVVLAIGVSGAAIVFGSPGLLQESPGQDATRYATVEYTVQNSLGTTIPEPGDVLEPAGGGDDFTIEAVAYSFTRDGEIQTIASVSYPGTPDVGPESANEGTQVTMQIGSNARQVQFLAVNRETPALDTRTQPAVLEVAINESVGHALEPGTTASVNGQTVATVESVTAPPDELRNDAELVEVTLQVWHDGHTNWFGRQAVRINNRLTIVTDDAVVTGRIYDIHTEEE